MYSHEIPLIKNPIEISGVKSNAVLLRLIKLSKTFEIRTFKFFPSLPLPFPFSLSPLSYLCFMNLRFIYLFYLEIIFVGQYCGKKISNESSAFWS